MGNTCGFELSLLTDLQYVEGALGRLFYGQPTRQWSIGLENSPDSQAADLATGLADKRLAAVGP